MKNLKTITEDQFLARLKKHVTSVPQNRGENAIHENYRFAAHFSIESEAFGTHHKIYSAEDAKKFINSAAAADVFQLIRALRKEGVDISHFNDTAESWYAPAEKVLAEALIKKEQSIKKSSDYSQYNDELDRDLLGLLIEASHQILSDNAQAA